MTLLNWTRMLKDDLGLHDKDINDNVIDTGDEWEVFDIIRIKA